jgi:hypothetical protein
VNWQDEGVDLGPGPSAFGFGRQAFVPKSSAILLPPFRTGKPSVDGATPDAAQFRTSRTTSEESMAMTLERKDLPSELAARIKSCARSMVAPPNRKL